MSQSERREHLIEAYNRMVERTREGLKTLREETGPKVRQALETARDKAAELGELSREEADTVADYIQRDVHDAAEYIAEHGHEFTDWLRLDLLMVEQQLIEATKPLVDQTAMELHHLQERAQELNEWHTGEVTGVGTLVCSSCGQEVHFHQTGHVPPCPKCHATIFNRRR